MLLLEVVCIIKEIQVPSVYCWVWMITNVQICRFFTTVGSINHISLFMLCYLGAVVSVCECVTRFKMNRDVCLFKTPCIFQFIWYVWENMRRLLCCFLFALWIIQREWDSVGSLILKILCWKDCHIFWIGQLVKCICKDLRHCSVYDGIILPLTLFCRMMRWYFNAQQQSIMTNRKSVWLPKALETDSAS